MLRDRTTSTIAHFIGAFDLIDEDQRLRPQLDPFAADRDDPDLPSIGAIGFSITSGHVLGRPDLPPLDVPGSIARDVPWMPAAADMLPASMPEAALLEWDRPSQPGTGAGAGPSTATEAAPVVQSGSTFYVYSDHGSVLTVTAQRGVLHDDDVLGSGDFR